MPLTKVTSGVRTLATDEVGATEIAAGAVGASEIASTFDISSKTVTLPAASVTAHVTQTDTSVLEYNIALLAFKLAAGDSLSKFSMVDQVIDEFTDNTGIDTTNSTNETLLSGYYSSGATSTTSAAWIFGAQASGAAFGTGIGNMDSNSGVGTAFDSDNTQNQSVTGFGPTGTTGYVGKDAGAYVTVAASDWSGYGSNDYGWNNPSQGAATVTLEYSSDNSTWTSSGQTIGPTTGTPGNGGGSFTESGFYRYWRLRLSAQASGNGNFRCADFSLYGRVKTDTFNSDMSLQSTTTTAEATPTSGDLVVLMEDASGTATLGTDILGYISRDGGSNWSSAVTWVDEGDWGTNKRVLVARNVDISGLAGTTSMRWKINTANQSQGSKETRIHAVSLGWS